MGYLLSESITVISRRKGVMLAKYWEVQEMCEKKIDSLNSLGQNFMQSETSSENFFVNIFFYFTNAKLGVANPRFQRNYGKN